MEESDQGETSFYSHIRNDLCVSKDDKICRLDFQQKWRLQIFCECLTFTVRAIPSVPGSALPRLEQERGRAGDHDQHVGDDDERPHAKAGATVLVLLTLKQQ